MALAFIAMGSNIASRVGEPAATMTAALEPLAALGCMVARSSLYSTKPVGFADQPRFVNAVIALETDLEPRALLEALLTIEQQFGRDRSSGIANGPRTLDLDLLLYEDRAISEPGLEIPHPRMTERAFVMVPLRELAHRMGDAHLPESVKELIRNPSANSGSDDDAVAATDYVDWRAGA